MVLYSASLATLPSEADVLVVPAAVGLASAVVLAVFGGRARGACSGLLVAAWVVTLGSTLWLWPSDPPMPFWTATIADWLLVRANWPVLAAGGGAVAVLLVARALDPRTANTALAALAIWMAAGLVADGLERLGALGAIALAPAHAAGIALGIDVAAALAVAKLLFRRPPGLGGRSFFVVLPCVIVLAAGPPDAIRATLAPGLENGGLVDAAIGQNALEPWRVSNGGRLLAGHVLLVSRDGRRFAIDAGHARWLGSTERWDPPPSAQPAQILPDVALTVGQLSRATRLLTTQRVVLAALDVERPTSLLDARSVRAAAHRVETRTALLRFSSSSVTECADGAALPPDTLVVSVAEEHGCLQNLPFDAQDVDAPESSEAAALALPPWPRTALLALSLGVVALRRRRGAVALARSLALPLALALALGAAGAAAFAAYRALHA